MPVHDLDTAVMLAVWTIYNVIMFCLSFNLTVYDIVCLEQEGEASDKDRWDGQHTSEDW